MSGAKHPESGPVFPAPKGALVVIDATGLVLGRMATHAAKRAVGTSRKGPFFPREPHLIVKRTCRGMINYQSSAGRAAYKRIKAHIGVPKELAGEKAQSIPAAQRDAHSYLTIAELASWLGSPREVE